VIEGEANICRPVFAIGSDAELFDLTLEAGQTLGGGREVHELDERVNGVAMLGKEMLTWAFASSFKFLRGSGFSRTVFISVMATSVFCTRSSSAFSTSSLACSCLAGLAFFKLQNKLEPKRKRDKSLAALTPASLHPAQAD
jgi:hypothetical protein